MNLIFLEKFRESVCIAQFFFINEIYSYICLRVFPVLWNLKIPTTTVGIITLNAFKRWLKQKTIVKNSST